MKKLLFAAAAVFAFGMANAQEEGTGGFSKGNIFVSGGVAFGSEKTGDFKSSGIEFSPMVGYFVSDNIAVGARLSVGSSKDELGSNEDKTSFFGAEVLGRYYWTPASQFSLFAELAAGFGSSKDEPQGGPNTENKFFGVNAGVGVNYFISNQFAIEAGWAGLGYNTNDNGGNGAEETSSFGLAVDLSAINFGLTYKF